MAAVLRWQAGFCERSGAPLYAFLLERSARDVEAGGPAWDLLRERVDDPATSALALRFMAGVHRIVLEGEAPELAAFYRTVGGGASPSGAWTAFAGVLEDHRERLRELLRRPCQTNEVGRSAALLPGFLEVWRAWEKPLHLLEIGASAGLNLRWDRYRYEGAGVAWGDPGSPVRLTGMFAAPAPPLDGEPTVAERRGCDPHPLDPGSPEDRMSLMASVWADQPGRMANLKGAFDVAEAVPAVVDRDSAAPWLHRELSAVPDGVATVLFHSVVLQYLHDDERERAFDLIHEAGARATAARPFAWLRFESGDWRRTTSHEVTLTMWPGGEERTLAEAGPHGRPVRWLPGSA
jgi:hypothetical protein